MYLINYDFYDLHALFVFFRRDPKRFPNYIPCLQKIVAYIETPAQNNHLCHNIAIQKKYKAVDKGGKIEA